jgi:soluble lytic murein transglycosylase
LEKTKLILTAVIVVLSVFFYTDYVNSTENTLFAYDKEYLAGRYDYLIDSLTESSDDAVLIRARTLATIGYPDRAFALLSNLDSVYLEAATIYFRYGDFHHAAELAEKLPVDLTFQSLIADYIICKNNISYNDNIKWRLDRLAQSNINIFRAYADLHLADYYYNINQPDSVNQYLNRIDQTALALPDRGTYHFLLCKVSTSSNDYDSALNYFKNALAANYLKDKKDRIIGFVMDSLAVNLDDNQLLSLAEHLRRNRFYDEAIALLGKIAAGDTVSLELAWSYFGDDRYGDAAAIFTKLQNSTDSNIRVEAYYGEAVCDYRRGRRLDGVNKLIDYVDSFPGYDLASRALFTAGDFYQQSDPVKAIELFARLTEDYPDSRYYSRSLYLLGKLYDKRGLKQPALEAFRKYPKDDDLADLFYFWQYKTGEADSTLLRKIVNRKSSTFYNYKARQRLNLVAPDTVMAFADFMGNFLDDAGKFLSWKIGRKNIDRTMIANADSLYKYGLEYEAGLYLVYLHEKENNLYLDLELINLCHDYNIDWAMFEILEDFTSSLQRRGYSFSYDSWNRLTYPVLYEKIISYHAKNKIDPYLALAVIKRESRFDPLAVSNVGALGLMQLMPPTAAQMAKIKTVPDNWIFEPGYNVRLGCAYLRWLKARLNKDEAVIAAYNAGPTAAKKWQRQAGTDTETFIETIGYDQSRNYTRWVIGDYYYFKFLWPAQFEF